MPHGMSDEDFAMLTPDEQAAMDDDDVIDVEDAEGYETGPEPEEDDDQDDGDDTDQDDDQDNGDDTDQDDDQDDDGQSDDDQVEDDGDGEEEEDDDAQNGKQQRQNVPLINDQVPEGTDERLEAIATEKETLAQQFDDGELTAAEFMRKNDALTDERNDLREHYRRAELSRETQAAQAQQQWQDTVASFVEDHPTITRNQITYNAMNQCVIDVANEKKFANQSGEKILQEAYKRFTEALGIKDDGGQQRKRPSKKPDDKAKEKENRDKRRKRREDTTPPNIGRVPNAEVTGTDDGRFGRLNKLYNSNRPADQLKADEMLAKMPESEQDAFLRSR